jgi:hypothetical protein
MSDAMIVKQQPDYDGLVMVVSPSEALRRIQELQAFVKAVMVQGIDYGTIPGTPKPTLLQPGAQKLEEIYGFSHSFEDLEKQCDWAGGFFLFRKRCVLTARRTGTYIGDGVGSCNSRESRYAHRWVFDKDIPQGVDKATLKAETKIGKNNRPYTRYRLPNEDIYSLVNTIEKMACKRSLVHAVIGATRSSGIFTQDVEDLPASAFGTPGDTRTWERDDGNNTTPAQEGLIETFLADLSAAKDETELKQVMVSIKNANLGRTSLNVLRDAAQKALEGFQARQPTQSGEV